MNGPAARSPGDLDRPQGDYDRPDGWAAPGAALVRSAATDVVLPLDELGRVHIVGIAGSGMSGLARILLARGMPVSGCEARDSDTVTALRALGADVHIGHAVAHLDEVDTLVYSTAIPPSHLELTAARERGLQVLRRASALASTLADRRILAVAGTHGKTTTTSLLTVAVQAAGLDPSYAIGGNLYETGRNAHFGSGEYAIVEADESDGSFLLLRPEIAIVTNVEADHLENHGDLAGVFRAFEQFVDRIAPGGLLVVCADDPGAMRIGVYAGERGVRVRTYGTDPEADVAVQEIVEAPHAVTFTAEGVVDRPITITLGALVGRHMALNGASALTVYAELGLDLDRVSRVWRDFRGVKRRFELRGSVADVRVYDDYAHHPTEIEAALRGARAAAGGGRLVAVFQPGTYSRTQTFAAEFARAMALADVAVVLDVFPAREEPIPGVTGALIADAVPLSREQVVYEPSWGEAAGRIAGLVRPGDVVVTMGIGDVYLMCPEILREVALRAERGELGQSDAAAAPAPPNRPDPPNRAAPPITPDPPMNAPRARADLEALGRKVARRRLRPRLSMIRLPRIRMSSRQRWLFAAALVVFLLLAGWIVAYSPLLAASTVRINGTHRLTAAQVITQAKVDKGTPLVRIGRGAIARRVEQLPDVLTASVSLSFPSTVVISVTERTAAGAVQLSAGTWALVDETGHRFNTVTVRPAHLPQLAPAPAVAADAATLAAIAQVAVSVPATVRAVLTQVSASGPTDVTLVLSDGRTVIWGASERNPDKARVLPALLARPGRQYNVTNPDLPYTRAS